MKATIYILLIVAYFQQVNCSVTCSTGWTSLKTGCYKFINQGTYDQVQAWCANEGGYTIEINNQEEQDAYRKFQQDSGFGNYNVWLGATDRAEEGKWNWGHSGKEVTFTPWASGQPDDGTTGNCIITGQASSAFKWHDIRCSYTGGKGLCEHDGTRTTTPEISTTTPTASPPTCPTTKPCPQPEPITCPAVTTGTACPEPITYPAVTTGTACPEPITCPAVTTCTACPEPITYPAVTTGTACPEPITCPAVTTCTACPEPITCPAVTTGTACPEPITCPAVTTGTACPEPITCPAVMTGTACPEPITCPAVTTGTACPEPITFPEPINCPEAITCPTTPTLTTTSIRPGICSDAGCRTAFNGLGMCVDHSTTNWANMSKIIDFSAGTKDGKCSKDCGCVCFKHRDCMSSKCEDHNGICLIPDLNDGTRLTFFIPNGYIKAFPCDETINCSCYVPKTLITPRTPVNSCKWNKKCSRKKGKCFRKQDKVPSQAKARGWCNKKRGCKCYKA